MSWYYADDLATVVGTGSSYVLSASDVGEQMYFEVSFTDDDGFAELAQYTGAYSVPVQNRLYVSQSDCSDYCLSLNLNWDCQIEDANGFGGVADCQYYAELRNIIFRSDEQMKMVGVVLQMCLGMTLMT